LIAGSGTEQWQGSNSAPLILYPFKGNFEAEVKVVFSPTQNYQIAGLGVRSAIDNNAYLRISRVIGLAGQGILMQSNTQGGGFHGGFSPYADDTVYLKIERRGSLFNFFYSVDGGNWVNLQKDYVFDMPAEVEIFLIAYSTNNNGVIAQFSDFQVFGK
jgi:regulation of enolase protein 1 (concanavalin A-like superfamily)